MADEAPRNPKMEGSNCVDCRVQTGPCPIGCNQCFYNRDGAFYCDINKPQIPDPFTFNEGGYIVRMNSGHDSNLHRDQVIAQAEKYDKVFFNTSMPNLDFPGPVVFTANGKEEEPAWCPIVNRRGKTNRLPPKQEEFFDRLMFVRLRVSPTNLELIEHAVAAWTAADVPVVLTFMAYYDQDPPGCRKSDREPDAYEWRDPRDNRAIQEEQKNIIAYTWRKRTINSYYCPTPAFVEYIINRMKVHSRTLVTICGTLDSGKCKDCRNCETYYIQRAKHLREKGNLARNIGE